MSNLRPIPPSSKNYTFLLFSISTLLSLNIIFFILYKASDYFTGFGFNESVIFHVFYGIQGFDISLYLEAIIALTALIFLLLFLSFKYPSKIFSKKSYHPYIALALLVLLWFQPLTNNLFNLFGVSMFNRSFVGDIQPVFNDNIRLNSTKNIVYVFAESLEKTYLDPLAFPNLTPNLSRLFNEGISFTNIQQTYGVSSTIAGMVAAQCGVPFDSNGIIDKSASFLPSLYCLGDILAENNYSLSYVGGASLKFAGKGNFYRSHHFNQVLGKKALLPRQADKNYIGHWGIRDDITFKRVFEEYQNLQTSKQKFGLFMLTLDTHHPNYDVSQICKDHLYQDGSNDALNAVHCSDFQIGQFVKRILKSAGADNTMIIIASDHLSPNSALFKTHIKRDERRNLLLILNSGLAPKIIDKKGTTLDISPSILSIMGANM